MLARTLFGCLLAVTSVVQAAGPSGTSTPTLLGNETREECRAALDIATIAFHSTNPIMTFPIPAPPVDLATLVLYRNNKDISGGDGIQADQTVFEKLPGEAPRFQHYILHWQREAQDGMRIVVVERPFSWRGSMYSLFLIQEGLTHNDFWQEYEYSEEAHFRQSVDASPILLPVLVNDRWYPPTILRDANTGALWVIDQGFNPSDWARTVWPIYALEAGGFSELCRIVFVTQENTGLDIMPSAVRRFADFADEALGPGRNEGTLQPTARIRGWVNYSWVTLAERPWALTAKPHNNLEEVEAGLAAWSEGVPARVRLRRNLLESLKPAEDALTGFLVARFALNEQDARNFSSYAIDYMLRSYFVFHSEVRGYSRTPMETPWPETNR